MEEDFDNEVGFWVKDMPYLWVQGDTIKSSKRFYLMKDYTLELFDENNGLTDMTDRKNVGMRTPSERRLSTSKETFSLIPIEYDNKCCRFVRDYFLVWTFSTRERDGKPILYKKYVDKKGVQRTRYNPWIHYLDIRIEGVRYKFLTEEHKRKFEGSTMVVLEGKESIKNNKTRKIRLRGYEFIYPEPKIIEYSDQEEDSEPNGCVVSPLMEKWIYRHFYYQDRHRKWKFDIPNKTSYDLLCRLTKFVERLFGLNLELMRREYPQHNIKTLIKEGENIYDQKPSLAKNGVTWSQNDYDHPGFHRAYIRYKSIQRFTETWALLRRAHNLGILYSVYRDPQPRTIRVASLAGGPGLELYALREFFARYYPHIKVECISLDLGELWRPYAEELGLEFDVWNVDDGKGLKNKLGGDIDFAIVSYALEMYMSKPLHVEWLSKAILDNTIPMLFVNSRKKDLLKHISEMKTKGVSEIDLISPIRGKRDNRQFVYHRPDLRIKIPTEKFVTMYPNVPYEK